MDWIAKTRAACWHGLVSLFVAGLAAVLVFGVWYPAEYKHMAGGLGLFVLLTSVDVVLGPMLTFAIWNKRKSTKHLVADLCVVALLQLTALVYGIWTVAQARPVLLAAENQLFRLVTAQDVKQDELGAQHQDLARGFLWGPQLVGTRASKNGAEQMDAIFWALKGFDVGTRPSYWVAFTESRQRAIRQASPFTTVFDAKAGLHASAEKWLNDAAMPIERLVVLPIVARESGWYAVMDRQNMELLGFARSYVRN